MRTPRRRRAEELLRDLWKSYQKEDQKIAGYPYPGETQRIGNGIMIHHFTRNVPPGFILPDHSAVMDAFFKRGKKVYFYVVVKPLNARDIKAVGPELKAFEKLAKDSLKVLKQVKWSSSRSQ